MHTLNYIPSMAILVVFGGKDESGDKACLYFNDLCILNLKNLNWIKIKTAGKKIV
jgi:hypothetical protein